MKEIREQHELLVGQAFIAWYNQQHRTKFTLLDRSDESSWLAFHDGDREIRAEVSVVYYDPYTEQIFWMHAPNSPDAPRVRPGFSFLATLTLAINREIADRCSGSPGPGQVLLIFVPPRVTTSLMMCEALERIVLPERRPFEGIYLVGQFTLPEQLMDPNLSIRPLAGDRADPRP